MEILRVDSARTLADFIDIPFSLYSKDPNYISQLKKDLRKHFSEENPFRKHADVKYFIAKDGRELIGRIASIINYRHMEFQKEMAGFFGFFESVNDKEVGAGLLDAVNAELKEKGLKIMRGPMNFSTNEECGFLTEGFDSPPHAHDAL